MYIMYKQLYYSLTNTNGVFSSFLAGLEHPNPPILGILLYTRYSSSF
uniref:Uncharacterized protein n=1 Tax=Picea sitchensis TaxID=3332 RepID=B8LRU3_PICSI|nr:unknown [Picea sitchensis]